VVTHPLIHQARHSHSRYVRHIAMIAASPSWQYAHKRWGRRSLGTRHGGGNAGATSAATLKSFFENSLLKTLENEGFVDGPGSRFAGDSNA
jgi:hypothetical protein